MAKTSVGRLQNLSVSVQRRWNNVLSDATRQVPRQLPALLVLCCSEMLKDVLTWEPY